MTHIANCMRPYADRESVYIAPETSFFLPSPNPDLASDASKDKGKRERRPSRLALAAHPASIKYQLWPLPDKTPSPGPSVVTPQQQQQPPLSADKMLALNAGRSPTSLSDTAAPISEVHSTFWNRSGSLSRRRKISVPELGAAMATVQELGVDSPTIPGRPPLRKAASDAVFGHERSSSAPGNNWRFGPFGDALVSCVTGPAAVPGEQEGRAIPSKPSMEFTSPIYSASLASARPLSPILSPPNSSKPILKVDTSSKPQDTEIKPEVPPKSPSLERKNSPPPKPVGILKPSLMTPLSPPTALSSAVTMSTEGRRSPNFVLPITPATNPSSVASPSSAIERGASPINPIKPEGVSLHSRNASDTSIMERGRPNKKSVKRQRSRTCSEVNNNEAQKPDMWKLPKGQLAIDASVTYHVEEKDDLHRQALSQAEKFEVLHKKDVHSLSRELRALDERCEYLRKTYKSLREGRQKLHSRMVSYLKRSETQIFSRESLLKQEEALAELDVSIDDFLIKLEQSENRRLRVRQKLLEHVAAALIMSPTLPLDRAESTPPRSPVKSDMSPGAIERSESIKVFADRRALDLFSDIEQAIGKMCEAC